MTRQFTKYPSDYVKADSDGGKNWGKISLYDKRAYWWAGAQFLGEDSEGGEWFVIEGDSDDAFFNFYLVYVGNDGSVSEHSQRRIEKDTYTTEQAHEAMDSLKDSYWDYYAE